KIEELGVKFTKIISSESTPNGQKTITAEMSQEEVLQLIKRIDQLEAKLTRAISNSQRSISSSRRSSDFDDSDAPKIGKAKPVEGEIIKQDRPLLDDVLDSVIVSVEKDEKSEK
ncbi:MAG: hypothetical protein U9O98_04390, partial [Asgard group archaeon]|nr:hypothetical protein [Asgard group archaeon]